MEYLNKKKSNQILNILSLFLPISFSAFPPYAYIFTAGDVDYRCLIPECEYLNLTFSPPWIQNAVPLDVEHNMEKCLRYATPLNMTNMCAHFSTEVQTCGEWVFKEEEITIVQDFKLTCWENQWKLNGIGAFGNIASFFGVFFNGILADRYGRKRMMIICGFISALIGIIQSFSNSYESFLMLELINLFISDVYKLGFLLGLELVNPRKRTLATAVLNIFFTIGEMFVPLAMWGTKDWRKMLRIIYFPGLFIIIYHWLIPESVQWLSAKKKERQEKFSIVVRKTTDDIELTAWNSLGKRSDANKRKNVNFLSSKPLLIRSLLCSFCWVANTFVYNGLSINSVTLAGNKYLNFLLVSSVTIPAYILMFFMEGVKRKTSLAITLCISGIACSSFYFVTKGGFWLQFLPFLIGKLSITLSFSIVYLHTAEMFPTTMRTTFLSMCSMIARIGSVLAPLTPLLTSYVNPVLIFGITALCASFIALTLPETMNKPMPENIEEAEKLGNP